MPPSLDHCRCPSMVQARDRLSHQAELTRKKLAREAEEPQAQQSVV
ncbi:hypothetical protein [Streptacidiphilus sp. EB129]